MAIALDRRRVRLQADREGPAKAGHYEQHQAGYAMVALLVGISIMAVALSVALPVWSTMAKREREEELVFRANQYARAIALYQRRYANAFPPSIDVLVQQKFLRKAYKDPITGDDFQPIFVGQPARGAGAGPVGGGRGAGIMGVVSKSDATSMRLFNGRNKYNEWTFVATDATLSAGSRRGGRNPNPPGANLGRGGRGGSPQPAAPARRGAPPF